MTRRKVIVLGCVLAAVAITLKLKLATPQGQQPLPRALAPITCSSSEAIWRCPNQRRVAAKIAKTPELLPAMSAFGVKRT
jgi:hypothetical protein